MAGIVIPYSIPITVTGGSGSVATTTLQSLKYGGHITLLSVKAALNGTMMNFAIVDANGVTVYRKKNITTEWLDNTIRLPVRGAYTFAVTNCDPDDTITVTAGFEEAKT